MFLTILQMGTIPMEKLFPIIIMVAFAVGDILLLKLGLVATKAKKRTRMKWVAGSFLIQFGVVFIISSPLFLLGIMGAYRGEPEGLVPIILLSIFIDFNVINILHQIGLKRSLIVVVLTFVPIMLIMVIFGSSLPSFFM
ncbi:MAG: hypothetical protein HWN79_05205 [Candidatus Lokiarchaeota archaeon]|nr:hypothetical protein [Candidatus Lokiarchaeota archaeon]